MHYGTHHHFERVQEYCDEQSFRWNHRHDEPIFNFERVLEIALQPVNDCGYEQPEDKLDLESWKRAIRLDEEGNITFDW